MQWRVVIGGAIVGILLFAVAVVQVLQAVWPRPGRLAHSLDEQNARWAEVSAWMRADITADTTDPSLAELVSEIGDLPVEASVPYERVTAVRSILEGGESVPYFGCTALPVDASRGAFTSPLDWARVAQGLAQYGELELANRVSREMRNGQDLIPHSVGVGAYAVIETDGYDLPGPEPSGAELFYAVVQSGRCADEVMDRFDWEEAEDYFGQGRVPPRWWYDHERERRTVRDYYATLLFALKPHHDDPAAMRDALAAFEAEPHPAADGLVSRLMTLGVVGLVQSSLDAMDQITE